MRTAILSEPRPSTARRRRHPGTMTLSVLGAAALASTAAIHLHLWVDGYRHVPTIGALFLAQGIVAALLAVAVVAWRGAALPGALLRAGSAGFLLATAGGLLLSNWVGLLGFHDHLDAPYAGMSLVVECVGAAILLAAALSSLRRSHRHR